MEKLCEETFDHLNETYLKNYDLTHDLAKIRVPLVNIFGECDLRFPKRATKTFKGFNEHIIEYEISGAGHFPFLIEDNQRMITDMIKKTFSF